MKHDNPNNEFIEFDGMILNVGSILQVIPNEDWEWEDESREKKKMMFVIHFLGGASLRFDQSKYNDLKKLLLK